MTTSTSTGRTIPETADALGISVRSVYRLLRDGDLVSVHVGRPSAARRTVRVTETSLQAYAQRTPATS